MSDALGVLDDRAAIAARDPHDAAAVLAGFPAQCRTAVAIEVERVPFDTFEGLITAGRLHDANAIAALYMARQFIGGKLIPSQDNT